MCGFTAMFSPEGGVDGQALARAVQRLRHRGPDDQRTWVSDDGRVGLGHARLSIIDLSTGEQPIANADGSLRIIHNGEFYGFEAIRAKLEAEGHRFRTHSDSEIALHLYEAYGTQCVHHLRGEFAFVIWDERNHTLFAARDRFGIKPMYYGWWGGTLFLASEAKAFFAAGVPPAWDEEVVYAMHGGRLMPPNRSLFKGIAQIPPGHFMVASPNHQRIIRYWDFDYPRADDPGLIRDPNQALEEFRATFTEAVRLRLRADVPVASYLSGGLDSCSILGVANRYAVKPLHAFTLTFEAGRYDEGAVAAEMAAHAGSPFSPLAVRPGDLADAFAEALWHGETPFMNAHAVAKFMLSRFVHDAGYKVVLTGEGSDEILGGYVHFRRDWVLHNAGLRDPALQGKLLAAMEASNEVSRPTMLAGLDQEDKDGDPELVGVRKLLGFVPSFLASSRASPLRRVLSEGMRRKFAGFATFRAFFNEVDVAHQMSGREPVNQSLYLWSKTALPNYLLSVLGDRMEMAHSIEGRVPFLDHKLVELMTRIPVTEKIKDMREKYLLREAARPVLTDTVYRREKHPFLAPPASLARESGLRDLINDTLRGKAVRDVPFYDPAAVAALLDESEAASPEGKAALDPALMTMLSFTLLQQSFGVGTSA